jgi:hypothetical protein
MKKKLDMNIINQKPHKTISSEEALKDVEPYLSDEDLAFLAEMSKRETGSGFFEKKGVIE